MGLVSEIKERWIVEVLSEKLSFEKKINLDLETRNVSSQSFNTMGVHKFNFKESFEVNENERAQAFAVALCGGDLKLKNWNRQVSQFIARTNFVNRFYSKSLIGKFDDKEVYRLFYEICLKERTWKAIKNSNVYSYLLQIHKKDEISFINKFAPAQLFLFKDRKPFSLEYKNDYKLLT